MRDGIIKYSLQSRIMHWAIAFIMLSLLCSGLYMIDLPKDESIKGTFYYFHKSFGMIVIPLAILRLVYRFAFNVPELPKTIGIINQVLSKFGVVLLYWFMFVIPMSGYMMSITAGHPVEVFGLPIPSIISENKELSAFFRSIHIQIWYFFLAMIAIHIFSSFKYLIYNKVNLFSRMW